MSREITIHAPQDEVEFVLSAERPISNKTVRMTVDVHAQVGGRDEDTVRKDIHAALSKLVDIRWNLGSIRRSAHIGDEIIALTAVARVEETENRDLENRARSLSKRGLQLMTPRVEYTFPIDEVEQHRSDLRLILLNRAQEELVKVNKTVKAVGGREYHLGFFATTESDDDVASRISNKGQVSSRYGSTMSLASAAADAASLTHTGKIMMYALVVLRRPTE